MHRGPDLDEEADDDSNEQQAANGGGGAGGGGGGAKPKTAQQRAGETVVRTMLESVNGESYSFRYCWTNSY